MIRAEKRSVSASKELWEKADAQWKSTMPDGNISRYLQKLMREDVERESKQQPPGTGGIRKKDISSTDSADASRNVRRVVERISRKRKHGVRQQ